MKKDHLLSAMNDISDSYLSDARQPVTAKRTIPRLGKAVLAAACLCALLVGGAFAAEAVFGVPIFKPLDKDVFTGEEWNGFTTIIELPEEPDIELPEEPEVPESTTVNPLVNPDINGVFKMPVDTYSRQARDVAAGLDGIRGGDLNFDSWNEAEEFLGIELMNNSVLEQAEPDLISYGAETADTETVCHVTLFSMDGILTAARTEGVYIVDRVEVNEVYEGGRIRTHNVVPLRVYITIQSYTKHSPIAANEMFMHLGFPKGYTFTPQTYTTPGGLAVNIVGVNRFDSTLDKICTEYVAQFALNGNAVTLRCAFPEDSDHALSTLKQVLDAFR